MYKLPAMYVGEYAERDAEMTLELWQNMKQEIQHQDIQSIFDLETELFPCLVDMRFLGVRVDIQAANELKEKLSSEEKECLLKVKKRNWSRYANMGSSIHRTSFFEKLRLPFDRTEKQILHHLLKTFYKTTLTLLLN